MPDQTPFEPPTGDRRAQLVHRIMAEGARRQRRRRRLAGLGGATALAMVVVGLVALAPGSHRASTVGTASSGAETTTTTTPRPAQATTTTELGDAASAESSSAVVTPPGTAEDQSSSATSDPTTTVSYTDPVPTLVCENSFDPACGPLVWTPDPGPNQPLTVTITTAGPLTVGSDVAYTITAHDPDADIVCASSSLDPNGAPCLPRPSCSWKTRYGPWATPANPHTQAYSITLHHTFAAPGTYAFEVQSFSGVGDGCESNTPYSSDATIPVTITVS